MFLLWTVVNIITFVINLYILVIVAQVALSWLIAFDIVNADNDAAIRLSTLLKKLTDPVFIPVRKYVPPMGGMDFTPLIVIIAIQLIPGLLFTLIL
ncbi:MAG: YggT family protein [Alphaproteobacteria bacterium]